jgi:hypothetical protein
MDPVMQIVAALAAGSTLRWSPDAPGLPSSASVAGGPVACGAVNGAGRTSAAVTSTAVTSAAVTGAAVTGAVAGGGAVSGPRPAPVRDAYARLWSRVRRSLASRPGGLMMLARHADAPHTWAAPLTAELRAAGAGEDPELVTAAGELLRMMGQNGWHGAGHGAGHSSAGYSSAGHGPAGHCSPAIQA